MKSWSTSVVNFDFWFNESSKLFKLNRECDIKRPILKSRLMHAFNAALNWNLKDTKWFHRTFVLPFLSNINWFKSIFCCCCIFRLESFSMKHLASGCSNSYDDKGKINHFYLYSKVNHNDVNIIRVSPDILWL